MFVSVGHPTLDAKSCNTTGVLVLGMHRSGTSSAAGALVRLGAAAPQHLIAPNADNEKGHWESRVITDLNDAILAAGDSDWKDWRRIRARQDRRLEGRRFAHARESSASGRIRTCRITGVEGPAHVSTHAVLGPGVRRGQWSVRALLPIRSPLEVGWSLNRRDGLSPAYGCLLWLRHVLDAEVETRGMARAVLDWPQFLGSRREALEQANEQLGVVWPYRSESALADIDQFVSTDLRHQRAR